MRVVDFSLKRRVTVSMVAVALILFGTVAFTRLSVNLMPDLSYPSLTVETRCPARLRQRSSRWSPGPSRRSSAWSTASSGSPPSPDPGCRR